MRFLGKPMKLNAPAEEVATFFAKMLDHEYTTKDIFRKNFFKDWRKVSEGHLVEQRDLHLDCFTCLLVFHLRK